MSLKDDERNVITCNVFNREMVNTFGMSNQSFIEKSYQGNNDDDDNDDNYDNDDNNYYYIYNMIMMLFDKEIQYRDIDKTFGVSNQMTS